MLHWSKHNFAVVAFVNFTFGYVVVHIQPRVLAKTDVKGLAINGAGILVGQFVLQLVKHVVVSVDFLAIGPAWLLFAGGCSWLGRSGGYLFIVLLAGLT